MAILERLGSETGYWDTTLRTDSEPLTKKKLEFNAKNLNDFDAVLFFTGGDLEMNEQQKSDSFPLSTTTAKASSAFTAPPSPSPTGPLPAKCSLGSAEGVHAPRHEQKSAQAGGCARVG